jgi:hypothetical protein
VYVVRIARSITLAGALLVIAGCGRVGFGSIDPDAFIDGSDAMKLAYREAVLADAPVGYWRLADSGAAAHDEVGGPDGAYQGGYTHAQPGALVDDPDLATMFDGTSGEINVGDRFDFPANAPWTLEIWLKEANTNYAHFITKEIRVGANPVDGYALLQNGGVAYVERVKNSIVSATLKATLPLNQFVYLVGTYDGAHLAFYVDGTLFNSRDEMQSNNSVSTPVLIGAMATGGYFGGTLDEVAIYDHALAPDRIALHHTIGVMGPQ